MAFGSMNNEDDAPMADINVTPLVDVMLVLLIVFMITMPVLTHSIPLDLPVTSQKEKQDDKKDIKPTTIAIDETGAYVFGAESDTKIELDVVKARLAEVAKKDPETVIAISAHKDVAYDYVAQLLDVARDAGLRKIGFVTEVDSAKAQ